MNLSDRGIRRIIEWETGGENYYDPQPEWPGVESGITIGVGWDLGHTHVGETRRAWGPLVPAATLEVLIAASGHRGQAARDRLPYVRHVSIPWEAALTVFREHTLPTWYLRTLRIYPQVEQLHGDCCAALVSLVFNRGPNLSGDRRREMFAIGEHLRAGRLDAIPGEYRAMKRLWPEVKGLRRRRDEEAELFEQGLAAAGE